MKIQIRKSVFETNSSSTHSLTFASDDEYNGWKNGTYILDRYCDKLVSRDAVSNEDIEHDSWKYKTYDDYFDDYDMKSYDESYTTKGGETVHVFGKYGYYD